MFTANWKLRKEIAELQDQAGELKSELLSNKNGMTQSAAKAKKVMADNEILLSEVRELKTKLRKQNAADLLLNALEAIKAPKKKTLK